MVGKRQYCILCAMLMGASTEKEIFAQLCLDEVNERGVYVEAAQRFICNPTLARNEKRVRKWYNIFNRSLNDMIRSGLLEKSDLHKVRIVDGKREECRKLVYQYVREDHFVPREDVTEIASGFIQIINK
jgi:hypothetical protein